MIFGASRILLCRFIIIHLVTLLLTAINFVSRLLLFFIKYFCKNYSLSIHICLRLIFFPYKSFQALLHIFFKLSAHTHRGPSKSSSWHPTEAHTEQWLFCLHSPGAALSSASAILAARADDCCSNFHFWKSSDSKPFLTFLLALVFV